MARPRSAGFEGQREQILAAAAQLFAQRGYSSSTMAEVAAASGISKATLYHYVRDKQDLLAQITTTHVQRLQTLVQAVAEQHLPPQEHLSELVLRLMQVYEKAQAEHRVLTEDVKFLPVLRPVEQAEMTIAPRPALTNRWCKASVRWCRRWPTRWPRCAQS